MGEKGEGLSVGKRVELEVEERGRVKGGEKREGLRLGKRGKD